MLSNPNQLVNFVTHSSFLGHIIISVYMCSFVFGTLDWMRESERERERGPIRFKIYWVGGCGYIIVIIGAKMQQLHMMMMASVSVFINALPSHANLFHPIHLWPKLHFTSSSSSSISSVLIDWAILRSNRILYVIIW